MAYQLKSIIGAMSFMVVGMSRMASNMSGNVEATPDGLLRIFCSSSSESGISFVVFNVHKIELIETTAPIRKAMSVEVGIRPILLASEMEKKLISKNGVR